MKKMLKDLRKIVMRSTKIHLEIRIFKSFSAEATIRKLCDNGLSDKYGDKDKIFEVNSTFIDRRREKLKFDLII